MNPASNASLRLLVEYLFLILPIAIYVTLESIHHGSPSYFFRSPEWSVGTIFLVLQTTRIHVDQFSENHNKTFTALLLLALVVIALSAGLNIHLALENIEQQSWATKITKWSLFIAATIIFIVIAGASIYEEEKESRNE